MALLMKLMKVMALYFRSRRNFVNPTDVFYNSFNDSLTTVIRETYLNNLSTGKRVLHFGFLDSPFSEDNIRSGNLLHLKIKKKASYTYGVDIDTESLSNYRKVTDDLENVITDIQKESLDLSIFDNSYDLIFLPEVLEHLQNPGMALRNLRRICEMNKGSKLCVTVPNAYFSLAYMAALDGLEIVHPTHYYYFSPCTLQKLLTDVGFTDIKLSFYSNREKGYDYPGITKNGIIALCQC